MKRTHYDAGLGERLCEVRKANDMSQEQFSSAIGVSRSAYQSYERAERDVPHFVVRNVVERFKIDVLWLTFDDGDKRVISRNALIGEYYEKLFHIIDEKIAAMDRVISRERRLALAQQMEAQFLVLRRDINNLPASDEPMIDSLIVMMSEAA